jgi:hypothetical protein
MILYIDGGVMPRTDLDWQERTKRLLKAELKKRDVSYRELAQRLAAIGVKDEARNISNKITRGGFSATWFFQCMEAIGAKTLHLDRDDD